MKTLIQFLFPTLKAVVQVIGLICTVTISSYLGIKSIAASESEVVERRIMAVRNADFQHINSRFDRADAKLDKILIMLEEK